MELPNIDDDPPNMSDIFPKLMDSLPNIKDIKKTIDFSGNVSIEITNRNFEAIATLKNLVDFSNISLVLIKERIHILEKLRLLLIHDEIELNQECNLTQLDTDMKPILNIIKSIVVPVVGVGSILESITENIKITLFNKIKSQLKYQGFKILISDGHFLVLILIKFSSVSSFFRFLFKRNTVLVSCLVEHVTIDLSKFANQRRINRIQYELPSILETDDQAVKFERIYRLSLDMIHDVDPRKSIFIEPSPSMPVGVLERKTEHNLTFFDEKDNLSHIRYPISVNPKNPNDIRSKITRQRSLSRSQSFNLTKDDSLVDYRVKSSLSMSDVSIRSQQLGVKN